MFESETLVYIVWINRGGVGVWDIESIYFSKIKAEDRKAELELTTDPKHLYIGFQKVLS